MNTFETREIAWEQFSHFLDFIFYEGSYFYKKLSKYYGTKYANIIKNLLIWDYIEKWQFILLKEKYKTFFWEDFLKCLQVDEMKKELWNWFPEEKIIIYLEELQIWFIQLLAKYEVYNLLDTNDCRTVVEGKWFKIVFSETKEIYYLNYEGKIYLEKELIWVEDENNLSLERIIFHGDGNVFIYNFFQKSMDRYDYTLEWIFERDEKTFLQMVREKETCILCVEDSEMIRGNFILRDHFEVWWNLYFLVEYIQVSKNWKEKHHILCISQETWQRVLEYQGRLIQSIEHGTWMYVSFIEEEFVHTNEWMIQKFSIVCQKISEKKWNIVSTQALKILQKVQKHTYPNQKESFSQMEVQLYPTEKDIYVCIKFFAGNIERDTPLYNFFAMNSSLEFKSLTRIIEFDYGEGRIQFKAQNTEGKTHLFDSKTYEEALAFKSVKWLLN